MNYNLLLFLLLLLLLLLLLKLFNILLINKFKKNIKILNKIIDLLVHFYLYYCNYLHNS